MTLKLKTISVCIIISCKIGFLLSLYSYTVELAMEKDQNYEAMCDISEHMSCSKAFLSEYGKGFGLVEPLFGDTYLNQPNSVYGLFFYVLISLLALSESVLVTRIMLYLNYLSFLGSIYLAYILYFKLYDFCIVCVATYVVNLSNVLLSNSKLNLLIPKPPSKKKKTH